MQPPHKLFSYDCFFSHVWHRATSMEGGIALPENRRVTRATTAAVKKDLELRRKRKSGGKTGEVTGAAGDTAATKRLRGHAGEGGLCINDALPQELVASILRKLSDLIDFGKARCVCKAWHQLASSPINRPPSPLWCVIQVEGRLRNFDVFSGKEYKMETPATPPRFQFFDIKGQGGLIALVDTYSYSGRGKYWIGNALLNKWVQVPMTGCGGGASLWKQGTSELVIDKAQDGSSSYKLVRFMYTDPCRTVHTLRVDIYDSRSRLWTAGAPVHQPHPFRVGSGGLKSCIWRGRIYVLSTVIERDTQLSIWEYDMEDDTFTTIVPLASLPVDPHVGQLALHSRGAVFQVQVREDSGNGSSVQLVVGQGSICIRTPSKSPVQVFAWDRARRLWVVKVHPNDEPARDRFWDPRPEDQDCLTSVGILGWDSLQLARTSGRNFSAVSVCRTDTLAEWRCKIQTDFHNASLSGRCFFPNFHDQP